MVSAPVLHCYAACVSFRGPQGENTMSKGDLLEMEGVIQDALGGGQYNIKVDQGGAIVRAQLSGRMRRHHIRVLPGDRVRVAVSPYDLTHGLIVYRGK
jgi:translation initiation factor IF-1